MREPGKKILIVEDEALLAMDLKLTIQEIGHSVMGCATSGEQALSMTESERPDIVLLDIKLGEGMDGIETSRRLSREYGIPVIFMTGNTDQYTLNLAMQLEPMGILKKPMNENELRALLQRRYM